MDGTFYVASNWVKTNDARYMRFYHLDELYRQGNEIGGMGKDHRSLTATYDSDPAADQAYISEVNGQPTGGRQQRLVNTDDFLTIAEEESKMELDWFFEIYLRQPKLPRLVTNVIEMGSGASQLRSLVLAWETPRGLPFPMPIDMLEAFKGKG